jgi:hypothetical protein
MKRLLILTLVTWGSACATTGPSSAKNQKASDCMAMCERDQPPPMPGPMGRPAGTQDTRSGCEKRCGM